MSLDLQKRWLNISIVLKLSIFYTFIFSICLFIMFSVIYQITIAHMCKAEDDWILEETRELELLFHKLSIKGLKQHMDEEANLAGINNAFYSLKNNEGEIMVCSNPKSFENIINDNRFFPWKENKEFFAIVEKDDDIFRVLYKPIDDKHILQSVFSLREIHIYKQELTRLFVLSYIVMLIIFCSVGILMIKSALHPVDIMTKIANEISVNNLGIRIPIRNNNDELNKLAHTLNAMLTKIEKLVIELKDMNANLAHDLRTFLSRICINIEISLLQHRTPSEYEKILTSSLEESHRVVNILNTILDISEVETGIIVPKKQKININDVVKQIVDAFQDIAKHKEISFFHTLQPYPIIIEGELTRIRQAVLNIMDNAIKYTPAKGEICIVVTKKHGYGVISVSDTGIGISQEALPQIFKRFYRADQARSLTGSGLGLALSNAIISAHKGFIKVDSSKGKGTSFNIHIPIVK